MVMAPLPGGTTPSSNSSILQTENNSRIGLGHFTKKSARSSGKASRFTAHLHTMLWPLGS
jgi:hypothetical protein